MHVRKVLLHSLLAIAFINLILIFVVIHVHFGERHVLELQKAITGCSIAKSHIIISNEHTVVRQSSDTNFSLKSLSSFWTFPFLFGQRKQTINNKSTTKTETSLIYGKNRQTSRITTKRSTTTKSKAKTPDPRIARCAEVRRRVSEGVVDFIRDFGDDELRSLIKPVFQKKKLVVWSLDHHIGPISDIRSLLEPLGVEFIEHTLYHNCEIMCTCNQSNDFPIFNKHNIVYVNPDDIERFYNRYKNNFEIKRSHAFLVSYSMAILPLYSLFNRSIIAVSAVRYERTTHSDLLRWNSLNTLIRSLASHKRHVIGANNLYDRQYIRYFTGSVPDYIPSFCAYTGVHYNPTRMSYLYARRPYIGLGSSWHRRVLDHFERIRANFSIYDLKSIYKTHDYADVAAHLGIVYVPYQVSLMSFFEQYTMGIPLFAPTLKFLVHLHMIHYIVYDKTTANGVRQTGSLIPPHSSMKEFYDPNNDEDFDSVQYWLSLSDFYQFQNVTLFESIEDLVEILKLMTLTRLKQISEDIMKYNRERLKSILRYWRMRLVEIAQFN